MCKKKRKQMIIKKMDLKKKKIFHFTFKHLILYIIYNIQKHQMTIIENKITTDNKKYSLLASSSSSIEHRTHNTHKKQ